MAPFSDESTGDWVQYHKIEERGWPEKRVDGFKIFWHKPVKLPRGARVWLIAGEKAEPRYHYYLIERFVVDSIAMNGENGENTAFGRQGRYLATRPRIDRAPWFAEFKKTMANFSRGLSPITNRTFVVGLEKVVGFS